MSETQPSRVMKILLKLVTPAAIGLYVTLGFSSIAFVYYSYGHAGKESGLFGVLQDIDQKTNDYRFKFRGIRPGSDKVAILAIDDRAVETIGRWPWPRDTIARAVENTFKYGAKVIAADIIFSEPTHRPEIALFKDLKQKTQLPPNIEKTLNDEIIASDPDAYFGETLKRINSGFILGNFYQDTVALQGYRDLCIDMAFKNSRDIKIWESDEILTSATDEHLVVPPESIVSGYQEYFKQIEAATIENTPPPKTDAEAYNLKNAIMANKTEFCHSDFLDPEKDPMYEVFSTSWATIKEADKSITYGSFDEWANYAKNTQLDNLVTQTFSWTTNIDALTQNAKHNGYFNALIENDGVIRKAQLIMRTGNSYMPSIAFKAFLTAQNANPGVQITKNPKIIGSKGIAKVTLNDNDTGNEIGTLPVDTSGSMMINYAGPKHTFPHVNLADMLDESSADMRIQQQTYNPQTRKYEDRNDILVKKAEFLKDKVLVLGATAIGIYDLRVTPFDENFPGVETHANVIDNLIRKDFLVHYENEEMLMPIVMMLLGVFLSLSLSHLGALSGLIFTGLLLGATLMVDRYLFTRGILVSTIFPLIEISSAYVVMTFYKYFTEERSKKELRATFSKYVSPAIVEEVLKDPKNLELGGRKERITVFFSDVRGFTTISEKLDPRALSDLLNSYLTPMTELVFKNRGTLDKYMGDAIMAFFGAPIHYGDHAQCAARCALQNLEKLKDLQREYEKKGLPSIDIGIGLNTGECSVGNMGSQTVRNYTVMGDAVNLASRLEGINKTYGTRIIISEFTQEEIKSDFLTREVDWVRVKGKLKPVKIFELLAEGKADAKVIEMAKYFGDGYQKYHERQFDKAVEMFNRALGQNPEDETSKIYIERCQEFISEPPPADWDGVYVMKTK